MSHVRLAGAVSVLPRLPHHRDRSIPVLLIKLTSFTQLKIQLQSSLTTRFLWLYKDKETKEDNRTPIHSNESKEDYALSRMIPEPDYDDSSSSFQMKNKTLNYSNGPMINEEGLILPRKLANPCAESSERRDLHKELKFNNKIGKNVLNQKSELQKALEKHRELQHKKDVQNEKSTSQNSLEKVLEERARRLEQLERGPENEENVKTDSSSEFLRMHAKLRGRVEHMTVP